jgi:hypothetical protein
MFPLPEENLQRKLISFKTCFQNVIKTLVYFSADVVRKKKSQVWWFMPVIPVLGRLIRKIPSLRPSWLCSETLTQQKKATSVCLIFCHSKQSSKSFLILKKKKKASFLCSFPGCCEVSILLPVMVFHLTISLKATELIDYKLKPLKPWGKINLSSF